MAFPSRRRRLGECANSLLQSARLGDRCLGARMVRSQAFTSSSGGGGDGGGWDGGVRNTAFLVATAIVLEGRIAAHLRLPLWTHHVDRGGELRHPRSVHVARVAGTQAYRGTFV